MLLSRGLVLSSRRAAVAARALPLLTSRQVSSSSLISQSIPPSSHPTVFRSWYSAEATPAAEEQEKSEKKAKDSTTTSSSSSSSSTTENNNGNGNGNGNGSTYVKKRDELQRIRDELPVTFADISRAQVAIRDGVVRTKCEKSYFLSELCGSNIFIKPEFRQFTGSFKERGARNALLQLKTTLGPELKGAIAASAGNHALALAYHGSLLGVPVTVVMPTVAPMAKVDKCRKFGARVIIEGAHIGESKEFAEAMVEEEGYSYVNGYDDPPIVAGAGTNGIEMIDDVPDADAIVVPIGGAGLIAGVACAVKTLRPSCKVIGVEPHYAASYTAALKAGYPVKTPITPTLADGLAVPMVGAHAFEVARHYVDECVLTTEKEISLAVLRLVENEKMVVEGGGATGLAALLPGGALDRPDMKNKNIIVPLCGGNMDTTVLGRVLERGLAADNRLSQFYIQVSDRPGGIAGMTEILHREGASVKDIYHERAWLHSHVDMVHVKCVVELQGKEHGKRVKKALMDRGYPVAIIDSILINKEPRTDISLQTAEIMTKKRESTGEENGTLLSSAEISKPASYVFFQIIRTAAISACILLALGQLLVFSRVQGAKWLQKVLRIYLILFCGVFVSSELHLEDKLKFLPALKNWVTRGFLYTFIAVIGYEEATTVELSSSGRIIPDYFVIFALTLASWTLFILGVSYAVMGVFCLHKISDRVEERYRQDREVLARYGANGSAV